MQLPTWLRDVIEEIAAEVPQRDLARAAAELTDAYRTGDFTRAPLDSDARRVAYIAQRMPATYAACARVFEEVRSLAPEFGPTSMRDLGAGPGTATLAALESWPTIERANLIEREAQIAGIGKQILDAASSSRRDAVYRVSTSWIVTDLTNLLRPNLSKGHDFSRADDRSSGTPALAAEVRGSSHDLVILSYALGEFSKPEQQRLIEAAWNATVRLLILIEPGTPRGFSNILAARDTLTGIGAHILAPCPRSEPHRCPMAETKDWCHFAQRVERTSLHRTLKGGELGYEDEKFSYIVLSRLPLATAPARVVRHPIIRKGHVELQLCTPAGVERITVGKSQKDRYRAARKAKWGDGWIERLSH